MSEYLGINPENKKQARIFYCYLEANNLSEDRHACIVIEELSKRHKFKVLRAIPQTLFNGWDFWVEFDFYPTADYCLPSYCRKVKWKGIGVP